MQLLTGVKHFGRLPDHPSNNSRTIIDKSEYEKRSKHSSFHFHPLFLLVSIIPFAAIAFYAGVIIRILMVTKLRNSRNGSSTPELNLKISQGKMDWKNVKQLPPPTVIPGKEVPSTTYTFKHFHSCNSNTHYIYYTH
eukprot:scaffold13368_cov185-Skeletonema_dohrnii-CCMP3373.AAC.2